MSISRKRTYILLYMIVKGKKLDSPTLFFFKFILTKVIFVKQNHKTNHCFGPIT